MDLYHIWCDLKPGVSDITFSEKVAAYLGRLKDDGLIESWRLTRRKLGLSSHPGGEFHIIVETRNMAQLEDAFVRVSGRREPIEGFHHGVNSLAQNLSFALYRDFPDSHRHRGEEKF
jgi:hypothetical protein